MKEPRNDRFVPYPVTLVGASRGLGRVLAENFHRLGAQVLVVARAGGPRHDSARAAGRGGAGVDASAADAPDRVFAVQTPRILILCGGAIRHAGRSSRSTGEFSDNWNNDVRMSFISCSGVGSAHCRRARPSPPSQRRGAPGLAISGGYAGAKQMQIS